MFIVICFVSLKFFLVEYWRDYINPKIYLVFWWSNAKVLWVCIIKGIISKSIESEIENHFVLVLYENDGEMLVIICM